MLVLITCCLVSYFRVLQDFGFPIHINRRDLKEHQTSVPVVIINQAKGGEKDKFLKVENKGKITEKVFIQLAQYMYGKEKGKRLESMRITRENMIMARKKENKKEKKLLSYVRQFSYPLEIDLPIEINNQLNGSHSKIEPINKHPYRYIHGAYDFCDKGNPNFKNKDLFLLILVKSSVYNVERRVTIRLSWNNYTFYNNINFKTIFLLGYDEYLQSQITSEAKKYKDIIQEDFQEAYLNNTLKVIMGFNWAITHCRKARYLFFVDDDYFVHVGNLANYLARMTSEKASKLLIGYLLPRSLPYRDNTTKWYISIDDYPFDRWPPYLAGGAFVTSMNLARKLQVAFPFVKYIGIDDSYLGIVAKKLGINLSHNSKFCYRPCKSRLRDIFSSHGFDKPEDMMGAWLNQFYNKKVYELKEKKKRVVPKKS